MKTKSKAANAANNLALLNDIDSKRAAIDSIKGELDWLSISPIPPADFKARVETYVDQLAQRYLSNAPTNSMRAPESDIAAVANFLNYGATETNFGRPMMSDFICWALGDALVEKICAAAEISDEACGPSLSERRASMNQLRAELYTLECQEEALICQGEEIGLRVARRPDADPKAVLGFNPQGSIPSMRIGRVPTGTMMIS